MIKPIDPYMRLLPDHILSVLKGAAQVLKTLRHKERNRVLDVINHQGEIKVTDIYVILRIEQSVCSQHLAHLRKSGAVTTRRRGKEIYYSINHHRIEELIKLAKAMCRIDHQNF